MREGTKGQRDEGTKGGRGDAAFTLVELLVIIAVIGALIGVLLPALSGARRRGWAAACSSNIRQLQLANAMYAEDYGRYMPAAVDIFPPPNVRPRENTHRWFGTRDDPSGRFSSEGGPITDYLDGEAASTGVRRCPAFAGVLDELERTGAGFESGCGGYGYNGAFVGSTRERSTAGPPDAWVLATRVEGGRTVRVGDDTGAPRHWFRSPARTVAFTDAALAAPTLVEYSFVEPPEWPDFPGYRPDPSIHFRHEGRTSVCWLDGHVSAERRTFTAGSGVYPTDPGVFDLGWFGAETAGNELFDYE